MGWVLLILGGLLLAAAFSKTPKGAKPLTLKERLGMFAFGAVVALIGLVLIPPPQTPQNPQSAQSVQPAQPAQPAQSSQPPQTEQASEPPKTQEAEMPPPPVLPGLSWVDITLNLEKAPFGFRFSAEPSRVIDGVWRRWAAAVDPDTGAEMRVEITSYGDRVLHYEGVVSGANAKPTASWFIPYLATAPFDGNPQAESKAWAEKALGQVRQKAPVKRAVGGVVFTLLGDPPTFYTLEVSHRDYEGWLAQAMRP